ncbi:MAG: SDR family oxidoreductase [Bacteroidota bacterium]
MILVTGANGHLGSLTIDSLLKIRPNAAIAGLVRSQAKGAELEKKGVEIRIGDYNEPSSIENAVQGIDTLLLISSSTLEGRTEQHKQVIEAAAKAGVGQIFYTSILEADKELSPLSPDHAATEKLIKASGILYTLFRNTFYMEFLPLFLGQALETGQWAFPSNGKAINLALRSEMAQALANALNDPKKHQNQIYEITSAKAYTLEEIAQLLSDALDKKITYTDLPVPAFEKALREFDLSEEMVAISVMTASTFANGALSSTYGDLETLLGRKPTGLETYVPEFIKSVAK